MNDIILNGIDSLDPKKFIKFFDNPILDKPIGDVDIMKIKDHAIWEIRNFLSDKECDDILNVAKEHEFAKLDYRNAERLLLFDMNNNLVKLIEDRLNTDKLLDKLNMLNWKSPYGFKNTTIDWNRNGKNINPCIRINKYKRGGDFSFHRDSSFTNSVLVKSNYTLLIYLNDDYIGGRTTIRVPISDEKEYEHNGLTIKEELNLLKTYEDYKIIPKKGKAVIFDQSLLHCGEHVIKGTKYILRTDLLSKGNFNNNVQSNLEEKIETLTKQLFRQAQFIELKNCKNKNDHKLCSELYEICISLRQNPDKLLEYPVHLEKYIKDIEIDKNILPVFKLISRSAKKYIFEYKNCNDNKYLLLKLASIYTILTQTENAYSQSAIDKFIEVAKKLFDLDLSTKDEKIKNVKKTYKTDYQYYKTHENVYKNIFSLNETEILITYLINNNIDISSYDYFINNIYDKTDKDENKKQLYSFWEKYRTEKGIYDYKLFENIKKNINKFDTNIILKEKFNLNVFKYNENYHIYNILNMLFGKKKIEIPFGLTIKTDIQMFDYNCPDAVKYIPKNYWKKKDFKGCLFACKLVEEPYHYHPEINLITDDFKMVFDNLKKENNKLSGKIKIESFINKSFNHASCQNSSVLLLGEKRTGFCSVKFDVDFVMSKKKIIINIKPLIIV